MSDVVVRKGVPDDLPKCAQIINDWIDATDWMPRIAPPEEIAANFVPEILERRYFIVVEVGGVVGGYLSLDPGEGHIHGFYVASEFRNAGAGAALMNEAKASFPDGLELWAFQSNAKARKFYEREGFKEIRRTDGDNQEKLADILYHWQPLDADV